MTDTILDIIQRLAPRPYRTTSNPRSMYMMACPLPDHEDRQHRDGGGSFSVNAEANLWRCYGCKAKGNTVTLNRILIGEALHPYNGPVQRRSAPKVRKTKLAPLEGVTLAALASAKGLDLDYLLGRGWADTRYFDGAASRYVPAVYIPYFDTFGRDPQIRYRIGLTAHDRFRWKFGSVPRLYGLEALDRYLQQPGPLILVEGETDQATLDAHGFPALGIPGAGNFPPAWADLLGSDVALWVEADAGGNALMTTLAAIIPELRIIHAPATAKDPTELAAKCGPLEFLGILRQLIEAATKAPTVLARAHGSTPTPLRRSSHRARAIYFQVST